MIRGPREIGLFADFIGNHSARWTSKKDMNLGCNKQNNDHSLSNSNEIIISSDLMSNDISKWGTLFNCIIRNFHRKSTPKYRTVH